ncbi:unnamed protein product [Prunus armeniaca]
MVAGIAAQLHYPTTFTTLQPQALVARATLHNNATVIGADIHNDIATPVLEKVHSLPYFLSHLTYAPVYTSNETLAHVYLGFTSFSPPDPRSQVDLNLLVDQLKQKLDRDKRARERTRTCCSAPKRNAVICKPYSKLIDSLFEVVFNDKRARKAGPTIRCPYSLGPTKYPLWARPARRLSS